MLANKQATERIPGYCALCVSRCGSIAVVDNGRFVALEPDPSHPTGKALCAKGRAAPELVYHPDRLLYPLKRTRPKGDPDPGWQRISWDEALDLAAARLGRIAAEHGPESVVFSLVSPSTSASDDSVVWVQRLMNAFGSPNLCVSMELCGWGRYLAPQYTFGASVPGAYLPDLENAGCILFWGYNPDLARLAHATLTRAALKRGARLIVVDPRRTGPAKRADIWLRVRPGTDGALALGIAQVMIERGWYDREFIRDWTNGPLLVRADNGRLLTQGDLSAQGNAQQVVAWSETLGRPIVYDPATGRYDGDHPQPALFGAFAIETLQGEVVCRPAFELTAELCRRYPPERVAAICGVERDQIEGAARLLWEARPVAYYAWSGVEMQSNATQIARAIAQLYALTGSLDARGGNVLFQAVPAANVAGGELLPAGQRTRALGLPERPLGPSRWQFVTSEELYRGILEQQPYGVRGLVGFGANLLLSHAGGRRGRAALAALDFYVHADLFMNPTAELADVVLPVASAFEREALKVGFEVSPDAQSLVQLRRRVVEPQGEARSDTEIVFDLATCLGLGAHFWDGDIEAAYRYQLSPSGVSLEALREQPGGVRAPQETRYRKFAEQKDGVPRGFNTPTRKVELYSETLLEHGYPPLPEYEEPLMSPLSRPELAGRYPLILTCAKHTLFCESQHRGLPSLRRQAMDPEVELHPAAAAERGLHPGDWVSVETPEGSIRARVRLNDSLEPRVVCGQHGWWQACPEIGAPGYDPFGPAGANFNLIIGNGAIDPISGSVPHRAYLCQIRRAD
ncbi:MAG: molybdopterin-dependent oxidoreductase [Chloroflexi bacterium]|nr:molybdopterin-dependent oxidoreductase [Chloroflexota bacterium]MCI0581044.1 molybdopterin-dependent oxidoreductase [Chloroflexota bacterium]MCI0645540.1 molybdopterin-dependent oxidoreductase [Chloroflexota bacterium]MCI0728706.1 molybdopterin-dependent oxidoreductase [Chloroflexota bacterium]